MRFLSRSVCRLSDRCLCLTAHGLNIIQVPTGLYYEMTFELPSGGKCWV